MQVENEPIKPAEEQTEGEQNKKPKVDIKKEIISWVLTFAVAIVAALVIRTFLFEPIRVDGQSMCDTLQDGEVMFVTKPEYLLGDPEFGDVVICKYPGRTEKFVKRVMGIPGDEIALIGNLIFRNGEVVEEPYLTPSRNQRSSYRSAIVLGEDEYFVVGDNRDNSHDCRNLTSYNKPEAITRDMIVGHVRWVVFPFSNIRGIE
ncbi:MAG: signal peptidase I [Clostridia bacterium]|nr:signal peptidase I [Clostridia bacterium]